jgi:cytochrome b
MLVWDAPVRVFHWLLVLCFAGAWLTADSERWRLAHITLGYTSAALVGFRLLWGLVGTRYARFSSFVHGPRAAWAYLRSLPGARPQHHVGHNPAGALAIVALLGLVLTVSALGWAIEADLGGDWLAELHEGAASLMLGIAALHVLGVAIGSLVHRENLVRAMIDGRKRTEPGEGIRRPWRPLAVLMLAAVLAFWAVQWQGPDGAFARSIREVAARLP